jgi:hypothetical protein
MSVTPEVLQICQNVDAKLDISQATCRCTQLGKGRETITAVTATKLPAVF